MAETKEAPKSFGTRKAPCAGCGGNRNCSVVGEYSEDYDDGWVQANTMWYILKCQGCEYIFVQTVHTNSEDYEQYYGPDGSTEGEYAEVIKYWPALSKRKKPDWITDSGIEAKNVEALNVALKELYGALDNDLHMLAAIGIRTAYDVASKYLKIDQNLSFGNKLKALVRTGRIDNLDHARLEMIVEAGNASAHRGWKPSPDDLNVMMNVLEHFIFETFVNPERKKKLDSEAAKVKKAVPRRSKRKHTKKP